MAKDYIPRKVSEFDTFQRVLIKNVADNAATWNIPAGVVSDMLAESAAYKVVYDKQAQKGRRTSVDVLNHAKFRLDYEKKIRQWVNAWLNSNAAMPLSTKTALGLKQRGKIRNQRGRITADVSLSLEPMQGGRIQIICREPQHRGRARLAHDSDGVEVRYAIGDKPAHTEVPGIIRHFSPVAKFLLDTGTRNIGKYLYVFIRWRNLRHEEKSGPWSDMHQLMIA